MGEARQLAAQLAAQLAGLPWHLISRMLRAAAGCRYATGVFFFPRPMKRVFVDSVWMGRDSPITGEEELMTVAHDAAYVLEARMLVPAGATTRRT